MGAQAVGLFGSDTACDVRDAYVDRLRSGMTGRQATKELLAEWAEEIEDTDDGPVFWLALAATQWTYGRLEPRVKARALRIISGGEDLRRWEAEGDPRLVRQRQRVLNKLRDQLQSAPPPETPVRVQKSPEPLKEVEPLWTPGQVVAYRLTSRTWVLFLTEGAVMDEYHGHVPYVLLIDWDGPAIPSAAEIRKLAVTTSAFSVYPYRKQPPPMGRVERLAVSLPLTGTLVFSRNTVGGPHFPTNWKDFDSSVTRSLRWWKARRRSK